VYQHHHLLTRCYWRFSFTSLLVGVCYRRGREVGGQEGSCGSAYFYLVVRGKEGRGVSVQIAM